MPVDDIFVSARWSSDGSEPSAEVVTVPKVEAKKFVGQHGVFLATIPSFFSMYKQYKFSSEDRFSKLEAKIAELEDTTTLLQETSAAFLKVARRYLLDRARTKLIAEAKDVTAGQPWSTTYNNLLQRGASWLQNLQLSSASLFLTVKGSGSAQHVGDKAAHQVKEHHVKLAVDNMNDESKAAWIELFNFVYQK